MFMVGVDSLTNSTRDGKYSYTVSVGGGGGGGGGKAGGFER